MKSMSRKKKRTFLSCGGINRLKTKEQLEKKGFLAWKSSFFMINKSMRTWRKLSIGMPFDLFFVSSFLLNRFINKLN